MMVLNINLVYDRMMVIKLYNVIENMIEINIWENWILKYVVMKFGWIKFDIAGVMDISLYCTPTRDSRMA